MAKIKVRPDELRSLAVKMQSSMQLAGNLKNNVYRATEEIRNGTENSVANNISSKMRLLNQKIGNLYNRLELHIQVLNKAADEFERTDKESQSDINRSDNQGQQSTDGKESTVFDLDFWSTKVSDAEYAKLCGIWNVVANDASPEEAFKNKLNELPENDPIRNIDIEQIEIVNNPSGMEALIIHDNDSATVIFSGTQFDFSGYKDLGDISADKDIVLGIEPEQEIEANNLINQLSKDYSNIVVSGHSLGGYLATSVTLKNSNVSKCIAFDPPGRNDAEFQNSTNPNITKITTYENEGSGVSWVGGSIGKEIRLKIYGHEKDFLPNHDVNAMSEALGGEQTIKSTWE